MMPFLHSGKEGVLLDVFVQPRASRNEIAGLQGAELKVRLTSPPVEGAANRLLIHFLAKSLGVPKKDVILTSGEKSRHKKLLLRGVDSGSIEKTLSPLLT